MLSLANKDPVINLGGGGDMRGFLVAVGVCGGGGFSSE